MNDREVRYLSSSELRVEAGESAKPVIRGYAAVFGKLSEDLGGFREIIRPGAFTRTLRDGADVRALVDHDPSRIIGRNKASTLRLSANAHGLMVEIDPSDTTAGRDVTESIRRGDLDGMSFAFQTVKDDRRIEADGMYVRELIDVELFDVSIVTYPAYPDTTVALRSLNAWKRQKLDGDAGQIALLRRRLLHFALKD